MPTYDKGKMMRLLEGKHRAHLSLNDLADRRRVALEEKRRFESAIRQNAGRGPRLTELLERLLQLPESEAVALKAVDVEEYCWTDGSGVLRRGMTGIAFDNYKRFIVFREKSRRLDAEYSEASRDFQDRYAIVGSLREAVMRWGFRDPELEL